MPQTPQITDLQYLRESFLNAASMIRRPGIDELLKYLSRTDFYTAPASTKYHGAWEGGLCQHSLDVYEEMKRLAKAYPELQAYAEKQKLPLEESMAIVSLFHDVCKINFYKPETRNRKNRDGVWESYTSYGVKERFAYGGHGSKSVFIIQYYIKLEPAEAVAVNCHMGIGDGRDHISEAYADNLLAWMLHVADEAACFVPYTPLPRADDIPGACDADISEPAAE